MMAIQYPDFKYLPVQESPWANIFENVAKGYELSQNPRQLKQEAEAKELANSLQKLALEHKPKEYALADSLKQARIGAANRSGTGSGKGASGLKGALATAFQLRDRLDPNSPTYQRDLGSINAYIDHLGAAGLPQIVRKEQALTQIENGYLPGSSERLTPERQSKVKNDLLLSLVKDTTDGDTRKKLINATNMNITMDSINPKPLVQYSGAKGQIKKIGDTIRESAGKGSPDYKAYISERQKAIAAAKQLRAYLGDSIQPAQQERLSHLTNPEAWNVSPAQAEKNFEYMRELLKIETTTLVRAATDASLYQKAANPTGSQTRESVYNPATGRLE